ncbi:DUF3891 family protein [Alkalicoccobacillus murimartini]|uniref:DUF3891 family protein n=1 Tax=Alkalicoccobacillus murimartini TaxID=171685 RepID=A0ABT9YJU5_9BACI|nr:DUF3891 family protein [Alkalicoccobacillus murimartini]MDQ0207765.1 hypothetical protein [Alkalicoccobacillus murimartini]
MIIRQTTHQIECIKQHDHAYISGEISKHWREQLTFREDVEYAIYEHDRAWIPLDSFIEKETNKKLPLDFISYPLPPKLSAYTKGVDEVQEQSAYAAVLCSKHFCSFFSGTVSEPAIQSFLEEEQKRQKILIEQLEVKPTSTDLVEHFNLLQFCDDLSLYICMNSPGTPKSEEVSWFKDGFTQPFSFAPTGIKAEWMNAHEIKLDPFPFKEPLSVSFPVYELPDTKLNKIQETFPTDQLSSHLQTITFIS